MFRRRKTAARVAQLILGVFLYAGLFCPCRGYTVPLPPEQPVKHVCCESCAEKQRAAPDDSDDARDECACESGCCASFLIPEKDDGLSEASGASDLLTIPAAISANPSIARPEPSSDPPDLLVPLPHSCGSLFPDLYSLLT